MIINDAWENMTEIGGIADNYEQSIDCDQAVDEDGKANYKSYYIIVGGERYKYTAEEMETFAQTW